MGDRPRVAAAGVAVWNPSFDVTPAALVTGGIITEVGMVKRRVGEDGGVSFDVKAAVELGVLPMVVVVLEQAISDSPRSTHGLIMQTWIKHAVYCGPSRKNMETR